VQQCVENSVDGYSLENMDI